MRIPAAAAILLAALTAIAACVSIPGVASPPKPVEVRVMTYNIHHGSGNDACTPSTQPASPAQNVAECSFDLDRIIRVIRTSGADIVALQEVDRSWTRSHVTDQSALLATSLGMKACFGANLSHPPDRHSAVAHEYGNLILSRFEIVECRNMLLPQTVTPAREQRGLLEALLSVGAIRVRVYSTHLEASDNDQGKLERTAQVAAVMDRIGTLPGPAILMGDLNARPDYPELDLLKRSFDDAWTGSGTGEGFTSPAGSEKPPIRRIDYVLVSRGISTAEAQVLVTADTRLASDHYPVIVRMTLQIGESGSR